MDWNSLFGKVIYECLRRSPHGERGLKCLPISVLALVTIRRSPHGERGLKYCMIFNRSILWSWSLSSRRAWIEIKYDGEFIQSSICRSPHGERGLKCCSRGVKRPKVESLSSRRAWIEMDLIQSGLTYPLQVALLTESVDWNNKSSYLFIKHCMSLSSRRAWIEMCLLRTTFFRRSVALLTESVDWNSLLNTLISRSVKVALLTESVDWNWGTSGMAYL